MFDFIAALPPQPPELRWAWWTPCHVCGDKRRDRATHRRRPSWESPWRGLAGSSGRTRTSVSCSRFSQNTFFLKCLTRTRWHNLYSLKDGVTMIWKMHEPVLQTRCLKFALFSCCLETKTCLHNRLLTLMRRCYWRQTFFTLHADCCVLFVCLFSVSKCVFYLFQALLWLMLEKPCVSLGRLRTLWTWRWSRTSSIHCRTSTKKIWRRFRYECRALMRRQTEKQTDNRYI